MKIYNQIIEAEKPLIEVISLNPSYDKNYEGEAYVCGYEVEATAHMEKDYSLLFYIPLNWEIEGVVLSEWWSDPSLTDAMRELCEAEFKARYFKKLKKQKRD